MISLLFDFNDLPSRQHNSIEKRLFDASTLKANLK